MTSTGFSTPRLPVVMTREEARAVLSHLEGDKRLMASLPRNHPPTGRHGGRSKGWDRQARWMPHIPPFRSLSRIARDHPCVRSRL